MTRNATRLIQPILFQALTNNRVYYETFDEDRVGVNHIALAQWADLLVIAPATANIIGKIRSGVADDLLTTITLAFDGPTLIVPAMNDAMWRNKIVQNNCQELEKYGYDFVGPVKGALATGEIAIGHIAPVEMIWAKIRAHLNKKESLYGHHFLIAGGRTEEEIDPIRVITNRASGRMALSCAKTIIGRGGQVTIITGPTEVEIPDWIPTIKVRNSKQLRFEIENRIKEYNCNCLIMATAVSDFQTESAEKKLKDNELTINLRRTDDIVKSIDKKGLFVVGFSLETENHLEYGRNKLTDKGLDLIIVNTPEALGASESKAWLIAANHTQDLGRILKEDLADIILDRYLLWSKGS